MGAARNHHVISRLVLRGFSSDGKHVVVLRKPGHAHEAWSCFSRVPLRGTAMLRDFNVVRLPDQAAVTTLEAAVARHVEDPAASALTSIKAAPLGPLVLPTSLRTAVCLLAGLLHANSPAGRERLSGAIDTPLPRRSAPVGAVETFARAVAFDRNDQAEVAAWFAVLTFMRADATAEAQENLKRLTILHGQQTGNALTKMRLTVYRLDDRPFLLLPDLPVLGKARPRGDLPDPGSFVIFPFDHRHLLVFDAEADQDQVRRDDDPRIGELLRPHFPSAPASLRTAREWSNAITWMSIANECYALQVEDVKETARRVEPGARVVLQTTPSARGPGIDLQ